MGAIRAVCESGGILSKLSGSWLEYFIKTAQGSRAILPSPTVNCQNIAIRLIDP
jgi:hypothetical protein